MDQHTSAPLEPPYGHVALCDALAAMLAAERGGTPWPAPEDDRSRARALLLECERYGLIRLGYEADFDFVTNAGHAFLAVGGLVDRHALGFFAVHIDDLHARAALLRKSRGLINRFVQASAEGRLREHVASHFVPPGWEPAVTEQLAVRFLAAGSALLVRIAEDEGAHCTAEALVLRALLHATWADLHADTSLTDEQREWAQEALEGAWHPDEGGEQVAALFAPDAEVDLASVRTWFEPLPGASAIGHLAWPGEIAGPEGRPALTLVPEQVEDGERPSRAADGPRSKVERFFEQLQGPDGPFAS